MFDRKEWIQTVAGQLLGGSLLRGASAAGGAGGPGAQHVSAHRVDVRDLGARGDGATDDAPAIQAAMDAAAEVEAQVYLPPGEYLLGHALALRSGIELRGAGVGATVLRVAAGADLEHVIDGGHHGATNARLSGFTLDGNGPLQRRGTGLVSLYGTAARCSLRDLRLLGAAGHALHLDGARQCTFADLHITGTGERGINIETAEPTATEHRFSRITVRDYGGFGIHVLLSDANVFENIAVYGAGGEHGELEGVNVNAAHWNSFSQVVVTRGGTEGIVVWSGDPAPRSFHARGSAYNTFLGCAARECQTVGWHVTAHAEANTFIGCQAVDNCRQDRRPPGMDAGFRISTPRARGTLLVGLDATDRGTRARTQLYGLAVDDGAPQPQLIGARLAGNVRGPARGMPGS